MKKIKPILIALCFLTTTYFGLFGGISEALNIMKFFSWFLFVIGLAIFLSSDENKPSMKKVKVFSCRVYSWQHFIIAFAFASQGMFWYAIMNLVGAAMYSKMKDVAQKAKEEAA